MTPQMHPQEVSRLARLKSYGVLDTPRDARFERLVFIAAQVMRVPIARINFVDDSRIWAKADVGATRKEFPRELAICAFAILQSDILVIEDTLADPRFATHPLVTDGPTIRFYAGVPLLSFDDLPMGTFCVLDRKPRDISREQVQTLKMLSREAEKLLTVADHAVAAD